MAMSANAVLMKFFKLPPAVRMMLALAGFGSLASILFLLLPGLRTRKGQMWLLIIGGIALVLFLLIWGIRRLLFGKKASKLDKDLESQGPTRGDVAEQEQIYREKFRGKLAELKTNGLNVYKLPWFILMGEPGSGKTASLIHSGLDFPLGKDEVPGFGGTRNYNWWFTNDAVILDTAGRIAFQEEGTTDKVEWEYFLKLLGKHRPRCPINGLIVAIPADKLLRDNAEERQQKATILRERLRQVHQHLGIRFPTFILVTKMDLVGGFSEFFEEIRVDLHQRNQMFGWSRPGEFQETYDPGQFPGTFSQVYDRLRSWSMRYLQRKATDEELGMIVTFPEAFRQLGGPLNDYIATTFQKSPLLEPPFFRGFYFTSAVQEGAPILDVFSRSHAGASVAERPTKAVDSKAFFIHDLYNNKVFPESGLVFRSAKHVTLNKRMRRIVWIGSSAMVAIMLGFFIFGLMGVRGLVTNPREDCRQAHEVIAQVEQTPASYDDLGDNLELAKRLASHVESYNAGFAWFSARLLFIGADINVPREYVEQIHARFVLDCVLRPVLTAVEKELETADLTSQKFRQDLKARERHLAALSTYTRWYGQMVGEHELKEMATHEVQQRGEELRQLMGVLDLGEATRAETVAQVGVALESLAKESRSFPREILARSLNLDKQKSTKTIRTAVEQLTQAWEPFTEMRADRTDARLNYWVDFIDAFAKLRLRYDEVLATRAAFDAVRGGGAGEDARARFQAASAQFDQLTKDLQELGNVTYPADDGTFVKAYNDLLKFLANSDVPHVDKQILRLARLEQLLAELWDKEFLAIQGELAVGAPDVNGQPQAAVYEAITAGRDRLGQRLRANVAQVRAALGLPPDVKDPLDYYAQQGMVVINEAALGGPSFTGDPSVKIGPRALGTDELVKRYMMDMRTLVVGNAEIQKDLDNFARWPSLVADIEAARPKGEVLGPWITQAQRELERPGLSTEQKAEIKKKFSQLQEWPFWRSHDLYDLSTSILAANEETTREFLLREMASRALATTSQTTRPGLARLMPDFAQEDADRLPFDEHAYNTAPTRDDRRGLDEQPDQEQPDDGDDDLGRRRRRAPTEPVVAKDDSLTRGSKMLLVRYHTRSFMLDTLRKYVEVRTKLQDVPGSEGVRAALVKAAEAYVRGYFLDWYDVFSHPKKALDARTLDVLTQCSEGRLDWPQYHKLISESGNQFSAELSQRFEAVIREALLFDEGLTDDPRDDEVYELIKQQLSLLRQTNQSIPHLLTEMRGNAPSLREGNPEYVFSRQFTEAWRAYTDQVEGLGVDANRADQPPDLDELRKQLIYKRAPRAENFPFSAPLVDLADYGQQLLLHHLDAKLAAHFESVNSVYPVVHDALDSSANLAKLARLNKMKPVDLIELLRQVNDFERRYGALYTAFHQDSPANRTIDACRRWVAFLYDDPAALAQRGPAPLDVVVAIVRPTADEDVLGAGVAYYKFRVVLPLLSQRGGAADAIELDTTPGSTEFERDMAIPDAIAAYGKKFQWDLMSEVTYETPYAECSGRNPNVGAGLYPETARTNWTLSGDPWALLLLIGTNQKNDLQDGHWRIPVRIETGGRSIGYQIGVKIGSGARPFPGPISPLEAPGERPKMRTAERYLADAN